MDKSIADLLKKLFTTSNILKIIAILLGGAGVVGAVHTGPKMASASGAPMNDVLNMLLPAIGGIVTWFLSNKFKVKPDLIQAVVAMYANPTDPVADLQAFAKGLAYLQEQWPNEPAMLKDFSNGVQKLADAVVRDVTKTTTTV